MADSRAHIETDIPARLDRLPWGRFHTLVIVALGITWILDGLEVTLAGSVAGALKSSALLHLTDAQIGFSASLYLIGAVSGAIFFGWLTDRLGRHRLFNITLGLYLLATALRAFSTNFYWLALFRQLTGAGGVAGPWVFGALIGSGERTAIAWGYAFGSTLMLIAAAVALGIAAERR